MPVDSDIVSVTAPVLSAVWIHDPDDPEGTIIHYLYHESRSDAMQVDVTGTYFAGRKYPVYDFSEHSARELSLPLVIPFAEDTWDTKTEYLQALLEARKAFIYRDKRARLIYGVTAGLDWGDIPVGSTVALKIQAADFDEEIA
jgi:hypothetical protein